MKWVVGPTLQEMKFLNSFVGTTQGRAGTLFHHNKITADNNNNLSQLIILHCNPNAIKGSGIQPTQF